VTVGRPAFDLLTFDELQALPDPSWLIDGVVPASGLAVVYGRPGAAKSFLALDWALSVASGTPWLGHHTTRRWVVYVAAEGRSGLKARASAWWDAHGRPELSWMRWLPEAVNLRDPREVDRVRRALASLPDRPGLLVVDTMARSIAGGDENAARDVGEFIAAVDALRDEHAALVVHHTGKDGDRERGSSALRAAADLLAKVDRDGLNPAVTLKCEKLKDAAEWQPLPLHLVESGGSLVLARPDLARNTEPDDLERQVLSYVREHGPVSKRQIRGGIKGRAETIDAKLLTLAARRLVEQTGDGWQARPAGPDTPGHAVSEAAGGGVPPTTAPLRRRGPVGTHPAPSLIEPCPENGNGNGDRSHLDAEAERERVFAKFGEQLDLDPPEHDE